MPSEEDVVCTEVDYPCDGKLAKNDDREVVGQVAVWRKVYKSWTSATYYTTRGVRSKDQGLGAHHGQTSISGNQGLCESKLSWSDKENGIFGGTVRVVESMDGISGFIKNHHIKEVIDFQGSDKSDQ